MRRLQIVLMVATCGLMAAATSDVRAEGFMSAPPKVGTAVTYAETRTMYGDDDEQRERKGEITLSCVGKEKTDDGAAYWIEIKRPGFEVGIQIYKVLVSEKKFVAGENPFEGFVRGYFKRYTSDDEFNEIDTEDLEWQWQSLFLAPIPSFSNLDNKGTEKIAIKELKLGELECQVREGTVEFKFGENEEGGSDGKLFLSDKVPFGLVKAEITTDIEFGEGVFSTKSVLVIKKITTEGAKTAIPDAK